MLSRAISSVALVIVAGGLILAAPAAAAPFVNGEFKVSSLETNNKIAQGPDGNMWVTLNDGTNNVAKITPEGVVEEFDLPEVEFPSGITGGPDNMVWVTQSGGVAEFSPANPTATTNPTSIPDIENSHSIVTGPDGNLWVATKDNLIKVPPDAPDSFVATEVAGLEPKDIDVAGSLLVVADNGGAKRVFTMDTSGTPGPEYPAEGGTQGVAGNSSGQIAFSQPTSDPQALGLIIPPGPPLLTTQGPTDPFGVALGADGAFWFPRFNLSALARLTSDNQYSEVGSFAEGSGPRQIAAGPGNTLWVTLQLANKVGRISGVDPPPAAPAGSAKAPETKIDKGPKKKVRTKQKTAKVKFRFSSPDAGAKFECALTKVKKPKKGKKAPKPKFKGCKSPKTYRVRLGKYRFEVRAVLAGIVDPSPAKRTFRVIRKR